PRLEPDIRPCGDPRAGLGHKLLVDVDFTRHDQPPREIRVFGQAASHHKLVEAHLAPVSHHPLRPFFAHVSPTGDWVASLIDTAPPRFIIARNAAAPRRGQPSRAISMSQTRVNSTFGEQVTGLIRTMRIRQWV